MYHLELVDGATPPKHRTLPFKSASSRQGYATREQAESRGAVVAAHYRANHPAEPHVFLIAKHKE
jgi:hypothetical protein